jgi:hypothetical protein
MKQKQFKTKMYGYFKRCCFLNPTTHLKKWYLWRYIQYVLYIKQSINARKQALNLNFNLPVRQQVVNLVHNYLINKNIVSSASGAYAALMFKIPYFQLPATYCFCNLKVHKREKFFVSDLNSLLFYS